MGYYNISATTPADQSTPLVLGGAFWTLNSSTPTFEAVFAPFLDHINNSVAVDVAHCTQFAPNLFDWWKVYYSAGAVATVDAQLGSRLLDEKALSTPLPELAEALRTPYPNLVLLGNLVSGPGVWNAKPAGGLGSMTPAWRKSVAHLSMMGPESKPDYDRLRLTLSTFLLSRYLEFLQQYPQGRTDGASHEYLCGGFEEIGASLWMLSQRSGCE